MKTKKLVLSALLAALVCVSTIIIKIPIPLGYINLGDCCVLLSAFILPLPYCALAAGIGSLLADLLSGFAVYAPATFIIKGVMALIACIGFRLLSKKIKPLFAYLLSALCAEVFMVLGYFLFESILYGLSPAIASTSFNALQGVIGLLIGILITNIIKKLKFFDLDI